MAVELSSGRIVSVSSSNAGAGLDGDHASGVTELAVDDAGEFFESGGLLLIDGDTLTYTGIGGDDDEDTIIFLSAPTSNAYDDNSRAEVLPVTPTLTAQVVREGEGASEPAVVLHVLEAFLPLGIRDPDDQEFARLMTDREGDGWVVYDVRGKSAAILPGALPSDGGDLDPDEESVYLDGPPDFYTAAMGAPPYLDYAAMLAATDATWAAAVALDADNGTIIVSGNTITTATRYYPVWLVATEGRQCRVEMDTLSATGDPGGPAETITLYANVQSSGLDDAGDNQVDDFEYGFEFSSAPDGMFSRLWYGYSDIHSAYEGSLPAGAVGWTTPDQFQTSPLVSLTPVEVAGISDANAPYLAVTLRYPIARWGFSGSSTDNTLTVTGLRVVRT